MGIKNNNKTTGDKKLITRTRKRRMKQRLNQKIKKDSKVSKLALILASTASLFTILGISITGIFTHFNKTNENYQLICENYNNQGFDLLADGEYEKSIEYFNKAIELETSADIENLDICYFNRGKAYYKLEKYEKAIADYSSAINLNPKAKYYSERSLAYEMIGDKTKAMADAAIAAGKMINFE